MKSQLTSKVLLSLRNKIMLVIDLRFWPKAVSRVNYPWFMVLESATQSRHSSLNRYFLDLFANA